MNLKIENDFGELSKGKRIAVFTVLGLVILVTISWAADGFSASPSTSSSSSNSEYKAGYQRELSDFNVIQLNGTNGELHCPLDPHSAFCDGYNTAMKNEAGNQ